MLIKVYDELSIKINPNYYFDPEYIAQNPDKALKLVSLTTLAGAEFLIGGIVGLFAYNYNAIIDSNSLFFIISAVAIEGVMYATYNSLINDLETESLSIETINRASQDFPSLINELLTPTKIVDSWHLYIDILDSYFIGDDNTTYYTEYIYMPFR